MSDLDRHASKILDYVTKLYLLNYGDDQTKAR